MALLLRSHLNTLDSLNQMRLLDGLLLPAGSQDGAFIHDVFQIRAGRKRCAFGNVFQIHIIRQGLALGMNFQYRHAAVNVRIMHGNLAVEPAWP